MSEVARSLLRARRDPEPAGRGARRRRRRHALSPRLRARGRRGRCRAADRLDDGQPLRADRADGAPASRSSSARTSTRCRRPAAIEPVVEDGVVRNAAGTILGARQQGGGRRDARGDAARARRGPAARRDRAAVHAEGGGRAHRRRTRSTTRGSRARIGYVYDQAAPIGEVILGAPFSQAIEVTVPRPRGARRGCIRRTAARRSRRRRARSRSSGSGGSTRCRPRTSGRSRAAPRGTSSPSGARSRRRRARTTSGGSPTWCRRCRTRSRSRPASPSAMSRRRRARATAATGSRSRIARSWLAAEALKRCGYEATYELSGGAADANVFNERGLQCVNLANGMTDIHTPNEHIAVADLEAMVDVTLAQKYVDVPVSDAHAFVFDWGRRLRPRFRSRGRPHGAEARPTTRRPGPCRSGCQHDSRCQSQRQRDNENHRGRSQGRYCGRSTELGC